MLAGSLKSRELNLFFALMAGLAGSAFSLWLTCGQLIFFVKIARGQQAEVSDIFSGGPFFFKALGANILVTLCIVLGLLLLIVPGIILAIMFSQYFYLIVDRNAGVIDSMNLSSEVTKGNKFVLFVLAILAALGTGLVTLLTCGIGFFAAMPFLALLYAVAYLSMTGQPTAEQLRTVQ
jgi:uncharacterized membrane protein